MPPLIGGAIVALAYIGMGAAGAISMTSAIVMAVVAMASAAASYALTSKAKAPGYSSLSPNRLTTTRDSIRARDIVYGRIRKGGLAVAIDTFLNGEWLAIAIAFAGHDCTDIEEIYFNEELAFDHLGNPSGRFLPGSWGIPAYIEKKLGDHTTASNILTTWFPDRWTPRHKGQGICYLVCGLMYNTQLFRSIPNITAVIKGKAVYDPRTDTTAWSDNPALCLADYLHDPDYGMGAAYGTDIATADLIAAANVCDELVTIPGGTEKRYTCNGILSSSEAPQSNIEMLLSSMAGRLIYSGGQWIIKAGAYEAPTVTFDQADFRGNLQVQARQQRRDLCNAVRGVFVFPDRAWEITDFPPVESTVFQAEDNGVQIWRDVELPFTTSETMAQRLAKIELYACREQIALTMPCSLKALRVRAGDTIALTHDRFGWTAKAFVVTEWTFAAQTDANGAPVLGCTLALRETSSAVYSITADEQTLLDAAPDTMLPTPFNVPLPGVPSVTESLYVTRDGAGVKALAHVSWSACADATVKQYQLETKYLGPDEAAEDYSVVATTPLTSADLWDVVPGRYAVRVKGINDVGVSSDYAETASVEFRGLAAPPDAPTGLTLSTVGGLAVLRWEPSAAVDVLIGGRYVFRHSVETVGAAWEESVSIGQAVPGSSTVAVLPLKPGSYLLKARDSSGMLSLTAAVVSTDAATILEYAALSQIDEHPTFSGTHSDTVEVDDRLQLLSTVDMDDWAGNVDDITDWDSMGGIPASGTYTFGGGFDFTTKTRVRLRTILDALVVNSLDYLDARTLSIDSWEDFDGTEAAVADATVWARWTDDDPAGTPTWSAWQQIDSTEVYARGVQCQIRLTTEDPAYNIQIDELSVAAEVLA